MKSEIVASIDVPDAEKEQYPYPMWSPTEEEKLGRWYSVLGAVQCAELWQLLTGRGRAYKQIDNKAKRMELQNKVPSDWLELFDNGE